jgi:hypothetical protein
MKKLRISLTVLAVLLAGATVVAESMVVTFWYRAMLPGGAIGANCDVLITGPAPCVAGPNQCLMDITVNGVTSTYRISKRIDNGPCTIVPKP